MTRHATRLLIAALAAAATLLCTSAPAFAGWAPPGTANSRYACGPYNKLIAGIWFQECLVGSPGSTGVYGQSVMAVLNRRTTSVGVWGQTWTWLNGSQLSATDCGYTTIAAGARKWCWGVTSLIGRGNSVQGQGWLALTSGPWYTAYSPIVRT